MLIPIFIANYANFAKDLFLFTQANQLITLNDALATLEHSARISDFNVITDNLTIFGKLMPVNRSKWKNISQLSARLNHLFEVQIVHFSLLLFDDIIENLSLLLFKLPISNELHLSDKVSRSLFDQRFNAITLIVLG